MGTVRRVGHEVAEAIAETQRFAVEIDGQIVPLLDLSPGVYDQIQRDTGVAWSAVLDAPTAHPNVAVALIEAAADKLGVTVTTPATIPALLEFFVRVDDDLPDDVDESGEGDGEDPPTDAS